MDAWTSYAIACYLNHDDANTVSSIESILRLEKEKPTISDLTRLEVLLLNAKALLRLGKAEEALKFCQENLSGLTDDLQREDLMGQIYSRLGRSEEALTHYGKLLDLNPSNFETYYKILECQKQQPLDILRQLQAKYPRVNTATRIALRYAED